MEKFTKSEFYVYRYIRKDTNKPFYVGKGKSNRANVMSNHNKYCKNVAKKHDYEIEFIMENLTEDQAFAKEVEFIEIHDTLYPNGTNFNKGGKGGQLGRTGSKHPLFGRTGSLAPMWGKNYQVHGLLKHIKERDYNGENNPMYGKTPHLNGLMDWRKQHLGRSNVEMYGELRAKEISDALTRIRTGSKRPQSTKDKISKNSGSAKKIICSDGRSWPSIKACLKEISCKRRVLINVIAENKSLSGLFFKLGIRS